jgi:phosphotransferase system HPr (HPr) family protein
MRPWSTIAQLASRYDCDLYLHKDGMEFWNFLLEGRPFINVKSVLSFLSMGIVMGNTVEFIATGPHASDALIALAQLLARSETTT